MNLNADGSVPGVYDPYSYNPMLRAFYVTSNFTNQRTQPGPDVVRAAAENPQAARHIYSVWSFLDWLKQSTPELYAALNSDLKDPVTVATGTALLPHTRSAKTTRMGLSGLGTMAEDAIDQNVVYDSTAGSTGNAAALLTDWGNRILALVPSVLQADQQRQIVKLNITRAERGLSPITGSALAPTVNVGASPEVQQMAYLAIGGLILAGLYGAFKANKK